MAAIIKPGLIYTVAVFIFVAFLFFSRVPVTEDGRAVKKSSGRKGGPKLKLHKPTAKVNPKLDHIPFDPIIRDFEEKRDDRAWEREYFGHQTNLSYDHMAEHASRLVKEHESEVHAQPSDHEGVQHSEDEEEDSSYDPDDYLDDDDDYSNMESMNLTSRLEHLFPLLDVRPQDGKISVEELSSWQMAQERKTSLHRTMREVEVMDRNNDGHVSINEYLSNESPEDSLGRAPTEADNSTREQWPLADLDGDGLLSADEFHDFLHPEDSENPLLHRWLRQEQIKDRDGPEKDGKLSFDEFFHNLYDELRDFGEHDPVDSAVRSHVNADPKERQHYAEAIDAKTGGARSKFEELDTNKDGYITEEELESVMDVLMPGERHYAKEQAEHMMTQADGNGDHLLELHEMETHPYVFYNVAFEGGEADNYHDEFRR